MCTRKKKKGKEGHFLKGGTEGKARQTVGCKWPALHGSNPSAPDWIARVYQYIRQYCVLLSRRKVLDCRHWAIARILYRV